MCSRGWFINAVFGGGKPIGAVLAGGRNAGPEVSSELKKESNDKLKILMNQLVHRLCRATTAISVRGFASLPPPTVIYSNNHLLVVNKPAGWHSIPLDNGKASNKCLLSWLKRHAFGGGSRQDFLLPLHRLDQPCSGLLLLAKTSKAASRITKVWKKYEVVKEYTCVLTSRRDLDSLERASSARCGHDEDEEGSWFELKGVMQRSSKLGSVQMMSLAHNTDNVTLEKTRTCTILWRRNDASFPDHPVIIVRTSHGAKHLVRSILAQVGQAPIAGDIRYGAMHPLPDRSVALHASKITLPDSLVLPLDHHEFVAPIPTQWIAWFS